MLNKKIDKVHYLAGGIVLLSSLITKPINVIDTPAGYELEYRTLYLVYSIYLLAYILAGLRHLINQSSLSDHKVTRGQKKGLVIGMALGVFFICIGNLFLPIVGLQDLGDLFFIIGPTTIITSFSYMLFRLKLFRVRLIVVRSFAYLFIIAMILFLYVSFGFVLNSYVFSDYRLSTSQVIINTIITSIAILLFYPSKKYLDRLSNRVFFKDSYDTQDLINALNNQAVRNTDLIALLNNSADIIKSNYKTKFVSIYLYKTAYSPARFIGDQIDVDTYLMENLHTITSGYPERVINFGVSNTVETFKEVQDELIDSDTVILLRLVDDIENNDGGVGLVMVGPKQSGDPFNKVDLKNFEIIANELVLAVESGLRFEEIEQFNVTLQKKIDDATKELQSSNDKLKALDEAKDEFVSMASHQLRTPLTSIKGYISMVMDGDAGKINKTQQQMLGQAMFSSQRMVYLISDLLNVSRLKTGKFIIEPKPVYLPTLVESELAQLEEGFATKQIQLIFKKPKTFPTIELDDMKIRQVIMNFVDNALYYTPSGGKITVELIDGKSSIDFRVKDTGIGVPKANQHKLFTKFYRADNARKARPDGTGLGLFMAKKVIIAQGGSIIFDSKEGKGSTFGFSFPKTRGMKSS